jgi:hypothetical protein
VLVHDLSKARLTGACSHAQVTARRRVSVREARHVEEALDMLRDAGEVDSDEGPGPDVCRM